MSLNFVKHYSLTKLKIIVVFVYFNQGIHFFLTHCEKYFLNECTVKLIFNSSSEMLSQGRSIWSDSIGTYGNFFFNKNYDIL